jgi:hypothetical protein
MTHGRCSREALGACITGCDAEFFRAIDNRMNDFKVIVGKHGRFMLQ